MTSRERLRVRAEVVYEMPVLPADEAIELFRTRAAEAGVAVADRRGAGRPLRRPGPPAARNRARSRALVALLAGSAPGSADALDRPLPRARRRRPTSADPPCDGRLVVPAPQPGREPRAARPQRLSRWLRLRDGRTCHRRDPDLLESLIDKNLLRRRPASNRYWMLVTIRDPQPSSSRRTRSPGSSTPPSAR